MTQTSVESERMMALVIRINKYLTHMRTQFQGITTVSIDQYDLLHTIANFDYEVTVADVAQARSVSRSAISRQVSTMTKKDLLYQSYNPDDRRIRPLHLTDQGAVIERIGSEIMDAMTAAVGEKYSELQMMRNSRNLDEYASQLFKQMQVIDERMGETYQQEIAALTPDH